MTNKDVCGADASATFNRKNFGLSYGQAYGFQHGSAPGDSGGRPSDWRDLVALPLTHL